MSGKEMQPEQPLPAQARQRSETSQDADTAAHAQQSPGRATWPRAGIRAVLFDLDDTLWSIIPVLMRAEQLMFDWLREHAPKVADAHTIDSMRALRMQRAQEDPSVRLDLGKLRHTILLECVMAAGEDLKHADGAMTVFHAARNAVDLFDDVVPGLERLSRSYLLGSISNGVADLERIGLAGHFRISISAHRFGVAKPDPAIFAAACEALEILPQQAVYVGDDPELDVLGAQRAGMQGVWMNRFGRELPAHVRPDAICTTLAELALWLDGQSG